MADHLAEIKGRATAATAGPWFWRGNVDYDDPRLVGRHPELGSVDVLGHVPVERTADDRGVKSYLDELSDEDAKDFTLDAYLHDQYGEPIRESRLALGRDWQLVEARKLAVFEVAPNAETRDDPKVYRADVVGIRHPDAEFIAASRADVDWLIGEVERLRAALGTESAHVERLVAANEELAALTAPGADTPAEPVIYRCDQSGHPAVPCSRCELVTTTSLGADTAAPDIATALLLTELSDKYGREAKRLDEAAENEAQHDMLEMRGEAHAYSDIADELLALATRSPQPNPAEPGDQQ